MRTRKWLVPLVAILACALGYAQTTTVTGTVLDPNGVRYSGGTVSAQMALASPAPSPLPALTNVQGALDSTGSFSIVLTSSQSYNFTLCAPAPALGPRAKQESLTQCFSVTNVAISGSTQDLTGTLNPSAATLGGFSGLDYLNSSSCATTCLTLGPLTFPTRDVLVFLVKVASYASPDIISLQFNGDTATNYWDRHITFASGGATGTDVPDASTALMRLAGNAVTTGRIMVVTCMNSAARSKACNISLQTLTGAAGTVGVMDIGGGEWVNTTAQITSVKVLTAGGSTMGGTTAIAVFGKNY